MCWGSGRKHLDHPVEVCEEVSRPLWLVGDKVMGIHCKLPGPLYKGGDLLPFGLPRKGQPVIVPQLYLEWGLLRILQL